MVLLDGKKLAQKILGALRQEIAESKKTLRLAAIVVGENAVVNKFVEQKKKAACSVGIEVRVFPFPAAITTNELRKRLAEIVHETRNTGVIVQLPLPSHINKQYILNAVVPEKDVDVLSGRAIGNVVVGKWPILPPVAGAIKAFFEEYGIAYQKKRIVVVGKGSLVGRPVALWLLGEEGTVSVLDKETEAPGAVLAQADIIISGIGKPGFITGEMVKKGAVVVDAGTSESEGKVVGDVDFDSVAPKASYITPVPGGIGPLTVAILLQNVLTLASRR